MDLKEWFLNLLLLERIHVKSLQAYEIEFRIQDHRKMEYQDDLELLEMFSGCSRISWDWDLQNEPSWLAITWSMDFLIALCIIGVLANFASPTRLKSIFGGFRNVAETPPAIGKSDNRGPILIRRRPSNSIWFTSAGAFKTETWALNSFYWI